MNSLLSETTRWLPKAATVLALFSVVLLPAGAFAKEKVDSVGAEILQSSDSSLNYNEGGHNYNFNNDDQNYIHFMEFTSEGGDTYETLGLGFDVQIQRSSSDNTHNIQYWTDSAHGRDMLGRRVYSMEESLTNMDFTSGVENLFQNTGGSVTNNIERVDFVYKEGIKANNASQLDSGFMIFERNANNVMKIAAITGVDANGNVTSMGNVINIATGDYGDPLDEIGDFTDPQYHSILSGDLDVTSEFTKVNSTTNQEVGGLMVTLSDLGVTSGQTIYGYALFGGDVATGSPAPVNISDPFYQSNTSATDGGMDLYGSAFVVNSNVSSNSMLGFRFLYWDQNGSSSGFGNDLDGTWDNTFNNEVWNRRSSGNGSTQEWMSGSLAFFNGTGATSDYEVEVDDLIMTRGIFVWGEDALFKDDNNKEGKILLKNENRQAWMYVGGGTTATYEVNLDGDDGFYKYGDGNMVLEEDNDIEGTVTVADGTLTLSNDSGPSLGNIDEVIVNNAGTIAMNEDNQLGSNVDMTLGGNFNTGGTTQNIGTLTLTGSSMLDLNGGGDIGDILFADSSSESWSGTIVIKGWTGDITGGTGSRIFFGDDENALTAAQLANITFEGGYAAIILDTGEIVADIQPVPEPSTMVLGGVLALLVGWHQYKRYQAARTEEDLGEDEAS